MGFLQLFDCKGREFFFAAQLSDFKIDLRCYLILKHFPVILKSSSRRAFGMAHLSFWLSSLDRHFFRRTTPYSSREGRPQ
jgi:hypothetical protein